MVYIYIEIERENVHQIITYGDLHYNKASLNVPCMMVDKTITNLTVYHMSVMTLLIKFTYHCRLYKK